MAQHNIKFAVVGDISLGKSCRKSFSRWLGFRPQISRIRRLVNHLNATKPDFAVFLGNLVYTRSNSRQKLVYHLQKELERLEIEYYLLPGTRDLAETFSTGNEHQSIEQFKQDFNSSDRFSFTRSSVQFIGLTSECWQLNAKDLIAGKITSTEIPDRFSEHTEFLQTQLDKSCTPEGVDITKRVMFVNHGFFEEKGPNKHRTRTIFESKKTNSVYDVMKRIATSKIPVSEIFCGSLQRAKRVDWKVQIGDEIFDDACTISSHRVKKLNSSSKFSSAMGTSATFNICRITETGDLTTECVILK